MGFGLHGSRSPRDRVAAFEILQVVYRFSIEGRQWHM
jgi:hypothetical protein